MASVLLSSINAVSGGSTSTLDSGLNIVRREQSARLRQHRGVLTEAFCECAALEIRPTETETACICDRVKFRDLSAVHFVFSEPSLFQARHVSANLMPGDSIFFTDERPYTILSGARSRSVILSIPFKTFVKEIRARSGLRRCEAWHAHDLKHGLSELTAAKEILV